MKAVILITMWKRPEVTSYVFRHYQKMQAELAADMELILLAVGSEGTRSRKVAEMNGFNYLEFPNSPLNTKYNAGVAWTKVYDPDMMFFVDSDAVITKEYFKAMLVPDKSNTVLGLLDYYFLNLYEEKLGYWAGYPKGFRYGDVCGPGRCFSREVLKRINWEIQPRIQTTISGNDWNCRKKLRRHKIEIKGYKLSHLGAFAMDIKSAVNIYSWKKIKYDRILKGDEAKNLLGKIGLADVFGIKPVLQVIKPVSKGRHLRLDIPPQIFYYHGNSIYFEPGQFVPTARIEQLNMPNEYFVSPKLEKEI